jgi:carboxypeptidase D
MIYDPPTSYDAIQE